jgi:hypothetical protein
MIPPTRYIDAGPGVPLANPQVAMAQGEAMARMGQTIQAIGERGFQIAEKVRRIDEAGKMSAIFANMEEDAAQFSLELMKREDTEAWPAEWKQRSQQWQDRARESGLSPEALAEFQERYTRWNTQRSIGFEAMAANKAVELGSARVANSVRYLTGQGKFEDARQEVRNWQAAGGMDSPAAEKALMDIEAQQAEYELSDAIVNRPAEIVGASDETLLNQFPGATVSQVRYAKQQAAKQEVRIATDTARRIEDEIYSDTPPTPEAMEMDPRFKSLKEGGHAKLAESLKRDLAARYDEAIQRQRATPQYQSLIMGKVSKDVAELDATDHLAVYQAESLLRQMEAGPMKNHLAGELARRINGEPEDRTAMGMNLRMVDEAFKNGFFAAVKPEEPARVDQLVSDGFLSIGNLRAVGFSEEQAKKIYEGDDAAKQTNARRAAAMKNLWQNRADKQAIGTADPFKAATVKAILAGESTVKYKSEETRAAESAAQWSAASTYAKTKKQLLEWSKANPKKAEDIDAVRAELLRIIGPTRDEDFIDATYGADLMDGTLFFDPLPEPTDLPFFHD